MTSFVLLHFNHRTIPSSLCSSYCWFILPYMLLRILSRLPNATYMGINSTKTHNSEQMPGNLRLGLLIQGTKIWHLVEIIMMDSGRYKGHLLYRDATLNGREIDNTVNGRSRDFSCRIESYAYDGSIHFGLVVTVRYYDVPCLCCWNQILPNSSRAIACKKSW